VGERSKVTGLPPEMRELLDGKLIGSGFQHYVQLQDWLRAQGYEIGKSSLHRYGSRLEEKVAKLKASAERARALVEASPDVADNMAQATMRLLQEKLYTVLESMDDIDPESVDLVKLSRAMAPLVRASIAAKKHADEVREKLAEADKKLADAAGDGRIAGVTPEALAQIRAIYTGAVVGPQP
jgi:DNA-directed RNA polymerase subunit F